jgi:ubiquinone biosynthesis protein
MFNLKKEVKDIHRFNHIALILTKQGFDYIFHRFSVHKLLRKKEASTKPRRIRETLEKLGPTFVKFGQILSLRPDLIPKEYVKELGNLQDKVPPFPYNEVEKILKDELKKPIKKLFKNFSKKPTASASISQVHKATLNNGRSVAVKVQRPNVKEIMDTDIEIMFYIAKLIEKHFAATRKYSPLRIVQEFKEWTDRELDFRLEARNAKKFHENFSGSDTIKIPKVYDSYSTSRILTTEYIDGIELHNISKLVGKKGYNIKTIIKNGFDCILTQVFIHGFFHADPHPSNLLILKGNKIALVDFGIVGYFDDSLKQKSIELLYGIVENDMESIVDTFLDMGLVDEDDSDLESFKREIQKVIDPLQRAELKDVKISYVLEEVLDIAFKYHVKMPIDFVLFGKALIEVEGLALEYEPRFKFVENAKPFLENLLKNEFQPVKMAKDTTKLMGKYARILKELPDQLHYALRRLKKGRIKVDIEDTDIKRLAVDIDKSSNRLTHGVIIAAFLVTGALLVNVGKPVFYNFPLFSLLCFTMSLVFSLILFVEIKKESTEVR